MTLVIWKYRLALVGAEQIMIPARARILTAQLQNGSLAVWALVDPETPESPRRFSIVGTGHPVPVDAGEFVATVQMGSFVWHVFVAPEAGA